MMTIDEALSSIDADMRAKCVTLGPVSSAEIVCAIAMLIAQMPRSWFDALLYERRQRIAAGVAFEPDASRRKAYLSGAVRRIGYGRAKRSVR